MGQKYIFSSRWEKNIVAILHFYGDRAIFLLLWDNQDTEPDLYEIKRSYLNQYPLIIVIKVSMVHIYIYIIQDR